MALPTADELLEEIRNPSLVNENNSESDEGLPTADELLQEMRGDDNKLPSFEPTYSPPKTWWGELKSGLSRGVDQTQETLYGAGALASDWTGWDAAKNYFVAKTQEQDAEIATAPASVESYDDVSGFDQGMRYFLGQLGSVAPQIGESVITAAAGAVIGTTAGPGGTVVGGLGGIVERQAVKQLIKKGVEKLAGGEIKNEIEEFAAGKITKSAMSEGAKELLAGETKSLAGKYGAETAIALNSVAQEAGSIYTDLLKDPNVSESDRRVASTFGGIVAALPDTIFQSWIASKFFPGVKPTKEMTADAGNYMARFAREYGKEILKVIPAESGTEYVQTIAEEAAKNWADPKLRGAIFTFSESQKKSFMDAAFGGAIGGLLGGGIAAHPGTRVPQHTDPKVRINERDVMQKADDLSPDMYAAVGPDDERLSAINARREQIEEMLANPQTDEPGQKTLNEELAKLNSEESQILGEIEPLAQVDESLVNEKSTETEAPKPAETTKPTPVRVSTPLDREISQIRALYAQQMPSRKAGEREVPVNPEAVQQQRQSIETLVNEIKKTHDNPKEADAYAKAVNEGFDDDTLNMFAFEGVTVRRATPEETKTRLGGSESFAVMDTDGGIVFTIPDAGTFFENAKRVTTKKAEEARASTDYLNNIRTVLNHETVHVAHLVALRDEWTAQGSKGTFSDFEAKAMRGLGAAMRNAERGLPFLANKVYLYGERGSLKDREIGQEVTRMLIELARTGQINEATEAIAKAQREQEGNKHGAISEFLSKWIESIKKIHAVLQKFLNSQTAPPELLKTFDAIQKTLDKYGVLLVNEKDSNETSKQKQSEQTKAEGTKKTQVKQESIAPTVEESNLTVGDALLTNAKVVKDDIRGRLVEDEDGALVLRTPNEDFLIQDQTNREASLSEFGVRVLRPSKVKQAVREAYDELTSATPADATAVLQEIQPTETEPSYYRDATLHPLLNQLADLVEVGQSRAPRQRKLVMETPEFKIMIRGVTANMLNKAENIITSTIDRVEKSGLSEERTQQLTQPFYDLWNGIEVLREQLAQRKAEQEEQQLNEQQEIQTVLPTPSVESAAASATQGEVKEEAAQPKRRRSKKEIIKDRMEEAIKAAKKLGQKGGAKMVEAIKAHLEFLEGTGEEVYTFEAIQKNAKEFKELSGATIKLYKEIADQQSLVNEKKAAKSAVRGEGPVNFRAIYEINGGRGYTNRAMELGRNLTPDQLIALREERAKVEAAGDFDDAFYSAFLREVEEVATKTGGMWEQINRNKGAARAARPPLPERSQTLLDKALSNANKVSGQKFSEIQIKQSEVKQAQGQVEWEGATPQDLYYTTQPHTESAVYAQLLVNEIGDALTVAESLQADPEGKQFSITEDDVDNFNMPDSKLSAVYENVIQQLIHVENQLKKSPVGIGLKGYLTDLRLKTEHNMVRIGTKAGQFNAYRGQSPKLYTAETARREHVDNLAERAQHVLGRAAKLKMTKLAEELNALWQKYAGTVVNSPKIIAVIRKMQALVDKTKFEKGYRQTVIKSLDRLKAITNKAAARAAEYMANEEDSELMANLAAQRIVREMSGSPKATTSQTENQLLTGVLQRMARTVGREMGLIPESGKTKQPTIQEQMAAVLKNEQLYAIFINSLHEAYVKEYGGPTPSREFLDEADMLYGRLANRMWQQDIVQTLVNEKMRELNLKFSEIVRMKYKQGHFQVVAVRDSIRDYMKTQGVTNEGLIEQLANDVEEQMQENIIAAHKKFFTSSTTIRDFLRNMQTTLAQAAKEHSNYVESMEKHFEDALENNLEFPNTPELPIAKTLAHLMQQEFNKMVKQERQNILDRWVKSALTDKDEKTQRRAKQMVERVIELANLGAMRTEDIYKALAEKFNLPPYSEELAKKIEEMGDVVANAGNDYSRTIATQTLSNYLLSMKGLKTKDSYIAWMYLSMLSGPGTQMVNIGGNLTSLMGHVLIESIKHPNRAGKILSALVRSAVGKAQLEAREAFFTGMTSEKGAQTKYFQHTNPFDVPDPHFESSIQNHPKLKEYDERFAKFIHWFSTKAKGQYVGRALMATDMFFYKIAEEVAYTARVDGDGLTTSPATWQSALTQARNDMLNVGEDPDNSKDLQRKMLVTAHQIYDKLRLHKNGVLVNERETAWNEANQNALIATFNQEPTGFLGFLAKHIQNFTNDKPIGKLIIPFTRIGANVANHMLEWTPIGFARYAFERIQEGNNPFKIWEDGNWTKQSDTALRAALGTMSIFGLLALMGDEDDEENPYFTIYGGGPRDINMRRQLQERGWKPNSVKIGDKYFSYLYTPMAMALAIVGRHMDEYREGRIASPYDVSFASSSVALLDAVSNQSFLATAADLMAAVASPDPERSMSRVFARISTIPIPNLIKQVDKVVDPSVQQSQGFWETFIKEIPVARHNLKPAINNFGEEVERTPGLIRLPGFDRFITMERTDDPVLNVLGNRLLKLPGFSKGTKLGDENMTPEQYYEYVKLAGPEIKKRISAELYTIKAMTKEEAETRLEQISREEKARARDILREKYLSR